MPLEFDTFQDLIIIISKQPLVPNGGRGDCHHISYSYVCAIMMPNPMASDLHSEAAT